MSIQYSLSGLSFCSADGKKYGPVDVRDLQSLIRDFNGEAAFEKVNLIVNTDRFVVVPFEIYDQDYEKDYLYTKNIVCGTDEIIMRSFIGAVVVIFPVDETLIAAMEKEHAEVRVLHGLVPCLEAAYRCMEKTKKHVLVTSVYDGVFAYAVVGRKTLLAVDCTADGGEAKFDIIMNLLADRYGFARGVVILDDGGTLAGAVKRVAGRVSVMSYEEYTGLVDEDSKR